MCFKILKGDGGGSEMNQNLQNVETGDGYKAIYDTIFTSLKYVRKFP